MRTKSTPQGHSPSAWAHGKPRSPFELLDACRCLKPIVEPLGKIARSDAPVLVVGESGTGKELIAAAIHEQSSRKDGPFVCVNIGAIPTELAETILFGHEKGAFTGATHSALGFCREAHGGTLFLDEIGEADLALQVKLLRFLENREVQPVGAAIVVTVDVRIVAATNRDLDQAVLEKQFREDLMYRISVLQVRLPPLRERAADINPLIDYFLGEFNTKYRRQCRMTEAARQRLCAGQWPGNIRQLRSAIETLVVMAEHDVIGQGDLSADFLSRIDVRHPVEVLGKINNDCGSALDQMTYQLVQDILEQEQGKVAVAAKRLGVSRATLYRWLKKYRQTNSKEAANVEVLMDNTFEILPLGPDTVLSADIRWNESYPAPQDTADLSRINDWILLDRR